MTPQSARIQGAAAAAFNDPGRAERFLRAVIRSSPSSDPADDAYALLCRTYLTTGLNARLVSTYRTWGAAFPASSKFVEQRNSLGTLRRSTGSDHGRTRSVTVKHERDAFTPPVIIKRVCEARGVGPTDLTVITRSVAEYPTYFVTPPRP